ncbi:hypothetical protein BST61_g9574 [Cercospora zeina]
MRLLSLDENGELSLRTYEEGNRPPYAILSHTWDTEEEQEVTYHDLINGRGRNKRGRDKIMFCAEQAWNDDLKHFWVDSCCIDKTSSAELTESLNSMFRWYQRASKCYVYLSDVDMMLGDSNASTLCSWKQAFQQSRWFTRGWTLQELIAPELVEFWSRDRYMLGSKIDLFDAIHERAGIPLRALEGAPMSSFSVNERFRWAAPRVTKKIEDNVYCLLGIFEVHMPPIYGEGSHHASERLKRAIHDRLRLTPQDYSNAQHHRHETMNEHRRSVVKSLNFPELGARQANIRNAFRDTGEWALGHSDYARWRGSDRGTFWIVGKPGAGKSTLMKFLHSQAERGKSEYEFVFGFFFNARGNTLEKTTNGLYRALLFELFTAFPELQILLDGQRSSDEWSLHSLKALLSALIQNIGARTLRLFVDALDECDEQEIQEMVESMGDIEETYLTGSGMLSICFASRHYPSITIRNGVRLNLDKETGHLDDLNKYIAQRLLTQGEGTLVHEIFEGVRRKANGVFLWAALVIDLLNKDIRGGRMSHVKKRLAQIPSGLSALFHDLLRRDNEEMEEFILCIQWILFARETLELQEFYFAMESGLHDRSPRGSVWRPEPWHREKVTTDQMMRFTAVCSLLDRGAEINASFGRHKTALQCAAKNGHLEVVRLLLDRGAEINAVSGEPSATALEAASMSGEHGTVRLLLDSGAGMNDDGKAYGAALRIASRTRHKDALQRLLRCRATSNAVGTKNGGFDLALSAAAACGHNDIVAMLLEHSADINARSTQNGKLERALSAAAASGHKDTVAMLLERGADVNARSTQNGKLKRALAAAASSGHNDIVASLLDHGAEINALSTQNCDVESAIYTAAEDSDSNWALSAPLHWEADIGDHSAPFATALYAACCLWNGYETVRLLVDRGADVNINCGERGNALSAAAGSGYKDVVALLLDRGADINACDSSTKNALYHACLNGQHEVVELLLDRGADMYSACGLGNAIQAACKNYWNGEAVMRVLLRRGTGRDHGPCLFNASRWGHRKIMQLLSKREIPMSDYWLREALEAACTAAADYGDELYNYEEKQRYGEIVQLLLGKGAKYKAGALPDSSLTIP